MAKMIPNENMSEDMPEDMPPADVAPEVGPTIELDPETAGDVQVGDELTVTAKATVTGVGDRVTLTLTDVTAEPDDEGQMEQGFSEGSMTDEAQD